MGQNTKILIIVLATLVIGFIIYLFSRQSTDFETESWYESYAPTDKGPYGTYVFKELLDTNGIFESFIQIDSKLEDQLIDNEDENDIYFFIGKEHFITETAFEELLYFVSSGNTAFISAEVLPDHVLDFFFLEMNKAYEYNKDSSQTFKLRSYPFSSNSYNFKFIHNNQSISKRWKYLQKNNIEYQTSSPKTLGNNSQGQINFIEIPYDEGSFFLHTSPYQFTNIAMFRYDGFTYAEDLIHHFPYGKIQWDIYNLTYHYENSNSENTNTHKRSVFQFIFQHTTLIWAFILLAITALLYAFFNGKRRQNIVVATELKQNSSLNYIETVSSLYLQERKHNKLVKLQKQSFIAFIANHYYIRSHKIDDKFIASVSLKSGIDSTKITAIFSELETLANQIEVSDQELIDLQQKIEHFYKTCK